MVQKMADQLIGASPSQLRTVQSFELNDNDVFTTTSVCVFVFVFVCCKCDRESEIREGGQERGDVYYIIHHHLLTSERHGVTLFLSALWH